MEDLHVENQIAVPGYVGVLLGELDPFHARIGERVRTPSLLYAFVVAIYCATVLIVYQPLYDLCFGRDPLFTNPPSNISRELNLAGVGRMALVVFVLSFSSLTVSLWMERDWKRAIT